MPLTALRPSQELIDLVGALGGTWSGNVAMCRCPAHADSDPSLSIRQGDRGFLVTCFAGCAREDVLRELRRVQPGRHFPAPSSTEGRGRGNPQPVWDQGTEIIGTLGETYLRGRHLVPLVQGLRFHPRCPYLPKPRTQFLPALLVPVQEGKSLTAIQRIFLDPEGRYTRKVMLGTPGRGAWQGGQPGETLAIAEGFETAWAFTLLTGIPCWASLGARRLHQMTIPPRVKRLFLASDNDLEGRRAAAQAKDYYARDDLDIVHMPPPGCAKDWARVLEARVESHQELCPI